MIDWFVDWLNRVLHRIDQISVVSRCHHLISHFSWPRDLTGYEEQQSWAIIVNWWHLRQFNRSTRQTDVRLSRPHRTTGATPTLGPNCMVPYINIFIHVYGIIQFGPKVGLAPVQRTCDRSSEKHTCTVTRPQIELHLISPERFFFWRGLWWKKKPVILQIYLWGLEFYMQMFNDSFMH